MRHERDDMHEAWHEAWHGAGPGPASRRTIDCDDCIMQGTSVCDDCVVSFVVGREPGTALVIDVAEARAVRMLATAGLVPELRHVATGAGGDVERPHPPRRSATHGRPER
jgi:hypothetical protein